MRKQKTKKNRNGDSQTIRIEFIDAVAVPVTIAVTFTECRPDATPTVRISSGPLDERPGPSARTCEYRLVVYGKWMPLRTLAKRPHMHSRNKTPS